MVNRNLRIVFMGTPEFAVPSLKILLDAGYPIAGVITPPDKPGGRGMKQMMVSPVKLFAAENNLKVLQPANLKSPAFIRELQSLQADLQVVVAFRMLPESVWNMPTFGTMNLHGSLLPAYRGAAPIQWAVIHGETMTGLTTFMLQHEIDAGQILHQVKIPVLDEDNAGTLHDRMSQAGAGLVLGSVDLLAAGTAQLKAQDITKVSYAPKITHEHTKINWNKPVHEVYNLIRGMSPYPGAWTVLDGLELKIFRTSIISGEANHPSGFLRKENKKLIVQAGDGELEIMEVQLTGKRKMTTGDFLNGYAVKDWSVS
jgi:methionyl-tRNA formyltransferase